MDRVYIEFNAKINTVTEVQSTENTQTSQSFQQWGYRGSYSSSYSTNSQKSDGRKDTREYSMNIKVVAVQDDMPAGMSRLLNLLEDAIRIRGQVIS